MKPLQSRLMEVRARTGTPWEVVERDYVLSLVLFGISKEPTLRESLVFKGGTALKKCYFGDYRFSEDLDFSTRKDLPKGHELDKAIVRACQEAEQFADEFASVTIEAERYVEKNPHPTGQHAFTIRARLPWHRTHSATVLVEISTDEPILRPTSDLSIIHEYGEKLDSKISVYSLEEIIAEKLRAILQYRANLERRTWARSRARDYYDLWRILGKYQTHLDLKNFDSLLESKCALRGVGF